MCDFDLRFQFREFLLTYNRIAEMCFADCTSEMKQRTVSEKEDECSRHCLEKYLKVTQRVTERFAEIQQIGQQGGLGDTANAFASTMKK